MRERSPDFLAGYAPCTVGFAYSACADVGEIGAGARFRVALAPELRARQNAGQKALALRPRAACDQRRAEQPFADMAHAPRTAGARIFFVKNHLLRHGQCAATRLRGPAEAGPATSGQFAFPCLAQRRVGFFVAGTAAIFQARELAREVCLHPAGDLDT